MRIPKIIGSNLARQKMVFPDDFAGEFNLVFIAFLRRHQDDIDEWVPFVEELAQEFPGLHYYEFPTLPRKGFVYRTLYLDKSAFRKALEITNEQNIWVYLFDRSGDVLWRTEGRITKNNREALRDQLSQS